MHVFSQQYIRITSAELDSRRKCDDGKCQLFTSHGKEQSEDAAIRMLVPQAAVIGRSQLKKK